VGGRQFCDPVSHAATFIQDISLPCTFVHLHLKFFDSLAVLLLLTRPRAGLVLTTLIIVSDVLINACVGFTYGIDLPSFLAQFVFMLFVLGTVRCAWNGGESVTTPAL
jgi:hypothetical protein